MEQYSIRHTDWPAGPGVFRQAAILSVLAVAVLSLAFCSSALAQAAGPAELTTLQKTFAFDDQLQKVKDQQQASIEAVQHPYAKALDALQASLQKAGDLNGLEVVAKEAARFKANGQLTEAHVSNGQPDLQALQEKYCAETAHVSLDKHLRVFALRTQYAARIADLQKRLTMAGRVEDAKAVRAEFERVAALPDVAAAAIVAKVEFEKDYAKYQELLARNVKPTPSSKAEQEKVWQALCRRWNVADAGRTRGTLLWNDGDGAVQMASAPKTSILPQQRLAVGQAWTNSLGMEFVPVPGTDVLFCKWETREQDYAAFAKDAGLAWQPPPESNARNPMVGVNWTDAQAFSKWLTEKEHKEGTLEADRIYRLPMDWEWSVAAGLKEDKKGSPEEKNGKIADVYPWGNRQLPPTNAGNYDPSLKSDSWPGLAPVGSFAANKYGMFDLGGNVWEWCEDFYNGKEGTRLLRGGSFGYFTNPKFLLSSYRFAADPARTRGDMGFRCVVTKPSR